jgi:hypothetical protein
LPEATGVQGREEKRVFLSFAYVFALNQISCVWERERERERDRDSRPQVQNTEKVSFIYGEREREREREKLLGI